MTLVVEAADPSGSLITAEFAKDLGRCVAAVPGRVTSSVARGTNNLLKDGATPISGTEDVLDELFGVGVRRRPDARRERAARASRSSRAVLDAAESCDSVEAIALAHRPPDRRGARGARAPRGRRLPRPPRSRRLGAGGALMPDPRRRLGAQGEELAARHLEARGFEVVERNFRTRYGELDIVARDARFLVFCEVKTRIVRRGATAGRARARSPAIGRAQAAAGAGDGARVARAGRLEGARPPELRFDAIGDQLRRRAAGCSRSSTWRARSDRRQPWPTPPQPPSASSTPTCT